MRIAADAIVHSLAVEANLRYNGAVIGPSPIDVPLPKFHFVTISGCG
jgi:hypothetical protein